MNPEATTSAGPHATFHRVYTATAGRSVQANDGALLFSYYRPSNVSYGHGPSLCIPRTRSRRNQKKMEGRRREIPATAAADRMKKNKEKNQGMVAGKTTSYKSGIGTHPIGTLGTQSSSCISSTFACAHSSLFDPDDPYPFNSLLWAFGVSFLPAQEQQRVENTSQYHRYFFFSLLLLTAACCFVVRSIRQSSYCRSSAGPTMKQKENYIRNRMQDRESWAYRPARLQSTSSIPYSYIVYTYT